MKKILLAGALTALTFTTAAQAQPVGPYGGGVAPLGDTCRVIVNNVTSKAKHTILIGGSLCDSILANIIRYGAQGDVVTVASGPEHIRNLKTSSLHVMGK